MSRYTLATLLAAATIPSILAQSSTIAPLADKRFSYPSGIPYKADPDNGVRGPQFGYNLCNSTTENQDSLCQTAFLNSLDDFCLWAPSKPDSTIADTEGEEVAWCTKPGRGTRLIPAGALQGVQFMRTPDYIQVVGFIDQVKINIQDGDYGGELDPHGADLRGNPLGGLVYSNGFPSNGGNNNSYQQVIEWHNFMGGGAFCFKACDPAGPHAADFCQHIYDRIGCAYNAPNNAQTGQFVSCQGDNQDYPGVYTSDGQVMTYTQPPESLGAITSIPYTARIPASSNCVTYQSSDLYASLSSVPTPTAAPATPTGTAISSHSASGSTSRSSGKTSSSGSSSATRTGSGDVALSTNTANSAASFRVQGSLGSGTVMSITATLFGVVFAIAFLA